MTFALESTTVAEGRFARVRGLGTLCIIVNDRCPKQLLELVFRMSDSNDWCRGAVRIHIYICIQSSTKYH